MPDFAHTFKIAVVLDTFSFELFAPEAELMPLLPEKWERQVTAFRPEMLLVESAWEGCGGAWSRQIHTPSEALKRLVGYCREQGIPTVFWNKEDPFHFEDFIEAAALFEYVFTTDLECIPRYRERLRHENVHLLPFAIQPRRHNPIEKYERRNAFVFAGSYYPRFTERNRTFAEFVEMLDGMGDVDIYDRHYGDEETPLRFPDRFRPYIRGRLDYDEIDRAHKGYRYALNLNSVTTSPTMFSRRVLELMASNTVVLSNYSVAIDMLLGNLVVAAENAAELKRALERLRDDPRHEATRRLAALRKVMSEYTAAQRMDDLYAVVFGSRPFSRPAGVLCLAEVRDEGELCRVEAGFARQRYAHRSLAVAAPPALREKYAGKKEAVRFVEAAEMIGSTELPEAEYIAVFSPEDYYGEHYLTDLMLATLYSGTGAVTKSGPYRLDSHGGAVLSEEKAAYRMAASARARESIVSRKALHGWSVQDCVSDGGERAWPVRTVLAVDAFHYCRDSAKSSERAASVVADESEIDGGAVLNEAWIRTAGRIVRHRREAERERREKCSALLRAAKRLVETPVRRSVVSKYRAYRKLVEVYDAVRSALRNAE